MIARTRPRHVPGALLELARLMVITRCRVRGRYWRWRYDTAFGKGPPPPRRELVRSAIAYGAWVRRMRRIR